MMAIKYYFLAAGLIATTSIAVAAPQMCDSLDEIYNEDFHNSVWATRGWLNMTEIGPSFALPFIGISKDPTCEGDCDRSVLEMQIKKGLHSSGRFFSNPIDRQNVWAQYKVFFPEDLGGWNLGTDQADQSKLPGFNGGGTGNGGQRASDGENGWSARIGWNVDHQDRLRLGYYVYHLDRPNNPGPGDILPFAMSVERGVWHTITQHVVVNTLGETQGNNDGILEAWLDDEQMYSRSDFRFTDSARFETVSNYWLNFYFGGNQTAPKDIRIYLDDLKICAAQEAPVVQLNLLFPNPAASGQSIHYRGELGRMGWITASVVNLAGQEVFESEPEYRSTGNVESEIELPTLSSGMYLVYLKRWCDSSRDQVCQISQGQKLVIIR